jgi:hypothetical protein
MNFPLVEQSCLTDLFYPRRSELRFLKLAPISDCLLFLFPLSIAFLGGQSVPDLLAGTTVLPRRFTSARYLAHTTWRTWVFLPIFSLLVGFLLSLTSFIEIDPKSVSAVDIIYTSEEDVKLRAILWAVLPVSLKYSDELLQAVEVVSYEENHFLGSAQIVSPMPYEEALKAQKHMRIVRVELTGNASSLVRSVMRDNMIAFARQFTPLTARPNFLILEFFEREDFGFFSLRISENNLLCSMDSGGSAVDFYVVPSPSGSFRIFSSVAESRYLVLGDLGAYAEIENLPVWAR